MDDQQWPRSGQRVDLELPGIDEPLVAVVDDIRAPEQLHVREPVQRNGIPGPTAGLGTTMRIGWGTRAGYHVLEVLLAGTPALRMRLWRLEPVGMIAVLQRRAFIRVADSLPVELHRGEMMWLASVCDLSEGGARCVLSSKAAIAAGDRVQLAAEIDGTPIRVDAVVVELERLGEARASVRLRFAELRREGDVIRRRVMDVQRRARALERL